MKMITNIAVNEALDISFYMHDRGSSTVNICLLFILDIQSVYLFHIFAQLFEALCLTLGKTTCPEQLNEVVLFCSLIRSDL